MRRSDPERARKRARSDLRCAARKLGPAEALSLLRELFGREAEPVAELGEGEAGEALPLALLATLRAAGRDGQAAGEALAYTLAMIAPDEANALGMVAAMWVRLHGGCLRKVVVQHTMGAPGEALSCVDQGLGDDDWCAACRGGDE